jgi:hypothetical protein
MIGIDTIVYVIVGLLVGGLILALLWWLVNYCEQQFPGAPLLFKVIRIVFVILVVLLLISILLHLIGVPLIRFGPPAGNGLGRG